MALKIAKAEIVLKDLELDEEVYGKDHGAQASFRQARQGDVERLSAIGPKFIRNSTLDEIRSEFKYQDYKREVVKDTMASCNILNPDDEDLFTFKDSKISMTDAEFRKAWLTLPGDIAEALADAAFEVNPTLQPNQIS